MKASDVFAATTPVFGEKVSFATAYPQVEHLLVAVTERVIGKPDRRVSRDETRMGQYVDCSNRYCYNGGVNVGNKVATMVRNRETHGEFVDVCQGYEGSPKGRKRRQACMNQFDVEIDITYKPETVAPPQDGC